MKRFITTAAIVTALALPAFAEGDDSSTKAGEAKGSAKASTDAKQDAGSSAMGQRVVIPRATTGAAANDKGNNESSPANPGQKTGVTSGADGGGGGSGASGGSGGGSQ